MAELKKTCPFCGTFPTEKVKYMGYSGFDWVEFSVVCPHCGIVKTRRVKMDGNTTFMDIERAMNLAVTDWDQRKG